MCNMVCSSNSGVGSCTAGGGSMGCSSGSSRTNVSSSNHICTSDFFLRNLPCKIHVVLRRTNYWSDGFRS